MRLCHIPLRHLPKTPICLLGCLGLALLLPDFGSRTRVEIAGVVLPTAPLSAGPVDDSGAQYREAYARRTYEVIRLTEALAALPPKSVEAVGDVHVGRASASTSVRAVLAPVLHRDTVSFARRSMVVGAGTVDGVKPGMPVLHGHSLCGVVQTVAKRSCRVLRVDDVDALCRFPAVVLRTTTGQTSLRADDGVCEGTADGKLLVSFLAQDRVRVGDVVVTGPGRHPIPEGLVLGEVERFDDDDRDGDWSAVVRPLRDLDRLSSVVVLLVESLAPQVAPRGDR